MIEIKDCEFSNPEHCQALIDLMNYYMADEMGGKLPAHEGEMAEKLVEGMKNHPSKLVLLAVIEGEFVGLTNCFINFGTFACKLFINVHDVVVRPDFRGKGVGRALMNGIIARAEQMDCGKITLEVREDNPKAQALYKSVGFDESEPVMHFWSKYF